MLLPAHVEALRCSMVKRVWKESTVVGTLPELMCDIMAYIPKPALPLDCPMGEIITKDKPDFVFTNDGIVYGVFKGNNSISLQGISSPGKRIDLVGDSSVRCGRYYNATCYYDADTSHLNVLHDDGGRLGPSPDISGDVSLIDFDVKALKVHEIVRLGNLASGGSFPCLMTMVGGHAFLGVEWGSGSPTGSIEVLCVDLGGKISALWSKYDKKVRLLGLHPVSASSPLTLDVIYSKSAICHSVRLELTASELPTVLEQNCSTRIPTGQGSPVFGAGILVVRSAASYSLFDSRLRRISSELSLPGHPECLGVQTDRRGGLYLSIRRRLGTKDRSRLLYSFPYAR
ncbi:hypothetical protein FOZ62_029287 [Perkinsus olseni]|uniref:Uncharacterized protein n=1 Tax=Perkinsus olseni TaxID=32597 RepID=A0A7J6UDG4_PEROL|nr:hypothetical protein FOZ62_029287 [Perkinsus olseni]